jgi:hypothetical protein
MSEKNDINKVTLLLEIRHLPLHNNDCQLPPLFRANESVIQLIACPPHCFRGLDPAVAPGSACDLDDDGLQSSVQQLV